MPEPRDNIQPGHAGEDADLGKKENESAGFGGLMAQVTDKPTSDKVEAERYKLAAREIRVGKE